LAKTAILQPARLNDTDREIINHSTTSLAKLLSERCEAATNSGVFRIINTDFLMEMVADSA
jgi:hypothetical protein